MIILDTNVVSELMKAEPADRVRRWARSVPSADRFLTAISVAELAYGVGKLPDGRRRDLFQDAVRAVVREEFAGRVLPFDGSAGEAYGALKAMRDQLGRPMGTSDAQIAAICLQHEATLATRNVRDFDDLGLDVIDPWAA